MDLRIFTVWTFLAASIFLLGCSDRSVLKTHTDAQKTDVVRFAGVKRIEFSDSGKFGFLQSVDSFRVVDAGQPLTLDGVEKVAPSQGKVLSFLPSDEIVYTSDNQLYIFDPNIKQSRKIDTGKDFSEETWRARNKDIVVVSDDLLLTGDGSYDWGGEMGNIIRLDLKSGVVRNGAKIPGFWYASLSSDKKFLMFEYGAEANNNAYVYQIEKDINTSFREYFNLRRKFPEIKQSDETPLIWLRNTNRLLTTISTSEFDESKSHSEWMALLDADKRTVVWKVKIEKNLFPTDIQLVNDSLALVSLDSKLYELNLFDGALKPLEGVRSDAFSVSPDSGRLALIKEGTLYVTDLKGQKGRSVHSFENSFAFQTAYKGMKTEAPLWSPRQDAIFVSGETETVMVDLR